MRWYEQTMPLRSNEPSRPPPDPPRMLGDLLAALGLFHADAAAQVAGVQQWLRSNIPVESLRASLEFNGYSTSGVIDRFRGPYLALSNFAPYPTMFDGVVYSTSEHAFVAAKTLDLEVRKRVRSMPTAKAKEFGHTIALRADWDEVRDDVMLEVLRDKFRRNRDAATVLVGTVGFELIEGNTWHDNYWGVCTCAECASSGTPGRNILGRLLMQVRRLGAVAVLIAYDKPCRFHGVCRSSNRSS